MSTHIVTQRAVAGRSVLAVELLASAFQDDPGSIILAIGPYSAREAETALAAWRAGSRTFRGAAAGSALLVEGVRVARSGQVPIRTSSVELVRLVARSVL